MDYWSIVTDIVPEDREPHWLKIYLMGLAAELDYEKVVWMDVDTLIVNPNFEFNDVPYFGLCKHYIPTPRGTKNFTNTNWHWNTGVIVMNKNSTTIEALQNIWERGPIDHLWHEQMRFIQYIDDAVSDIPDIVTELPGELNYTKNASRVSGSPIIKAWHGYGLRCIEEMKKEVLCVETRC